MYSINITYHFQKRQLLQYRDTANMLEIDY